MHSFSQLELRKLGVMIENYMKSFTKGAGKWQTNPAASGGEISCGGVASRAP